MKHQRTKITLLPASQMHSMGTTWSSTALGLHDPDTYDGSEQPPIGCCCGLWSCLKRLFGTRSPRPMAAEAFESEGCPRQVNVVLELSEEENVRSELIMGEKDEACDTSGSPKPEEEQKRLAEFFSLVGVLRAVLTSWKADIEEAVAAQKQEERVAESFSLLADIRSVLASWRNDIKEAETAYKEEEEEECRKRVARTVLKSKKSDIKRQAPAMTDSVQPRNDKTGMKKPTPPAPAYTLMLRPRGMIYTFVSDVVDPPATLVMGADKEENDNLIQQASDSLLFFHVDKYPSAHVYLQLEPRQGMRDVSDALLHDAAQLCKANSTQGKKLSNVVVIYTVGSNLKKTPRMKAGEVGFFSTRDVKKILVKKQDDKVLARLNDTKRKVLSPRLEREKEERARQHQLQKAKAKEQKRRQSEQKEKQEGNVQGEDDTEESPEQAYGTEPEQAPRPARTQDGTSRRRRKERVGGNDEGDSEPEAEAPPQQQTSRCFPVAPEQRHILQGCRATVERRHDVRVNPPKKGATDGRGTVTGAAEDVAEALAELRKILNPSPT